MIARTYRGCFFIILMKEVFIACTLLWIPFIILGIATFIKILRKEPNSHKEDFNPFEESNMLIRHAIDSYREMMKKKERTIRENSDSFHSKP